MRTFQRILAMLLVAATLVSGAVFASAAETEEPVVMDLQPAGEGEASAYQEPDKQQRGSYPLIYVSTSDSTPAVAYGEIGKMVFTISPKYSNERYNVEFYDSTGKKVASASNSIYNYNILFRDVTITIDTGKLNMKPGLYTVKYWMDFYSFQEWHSAPNSYTTTFRVVENLCNGNHDMGQSRIWTEASCEKEGKAEMKCTRCGCINYRTIPMIGHNYVAGKVLTEPTDDTEGTRQYVCSVCDDTGTGVIPPLKTAPEKPYKIANVVSGVHVYWTGMEGAQKYGLWRSETGRNGTYKWVANPTVAHFTDTKVTSGKTYFYKVTILNTDHNIHTDQSEPIGITFVSTPDITLRVNRAAGIGLRWEKISGATGYAIYRKSYAGNDAWARIATISDPNTLSWDDTSVKNKNGEIYKYTIRALAGADSKTLSGCRNAGRTMVRLTSRTLDGVFPAGAGSAKVTWGTTAQATGYEIRFMMDGMVYDTITIGNYKTSTKTVKDLIPGTYKVQVRAYKSVKGVGSFYSAWSSAKTVTVK